MRALMTIDAVGGVFTHALDLTRALHEEGVEVTIAVLGPRLTLVQRQRLEAAGPAAVYESGGRLEWMEDPWEDLERTSEWLLELARDERPDVVHANSFFGGRLSFDAPVLVVAHSCVLSWWRAVHGTAAPPAWERYRELVRAGLVSAGAVVAPSRAMRDALMAEYGLSAAVIHNGNLAPGAAPAGKERFALAAGRMWDEAKNLAVLREAAPLMRHPVLVAGEPGPATERSGQPRLQLLGALEPEALAHVRRRAAAFVAPARYEPFGLSILEAARDGCALVLGDIPSLRELWDGAARFVAPGDPEALARVLDQVLGEADLAMSLGCRAQRHAQRYSATAMAAAYARLYRSLARVEVAA